MRIGRYETIRAIGTGGMGVVYLGRALGAQGFERLVAIKVMHPHLASDQEFVGMFLDEARLAARVLHPNVVATHDVQQGPFGLFLVMDYVPGPSLKAILRAQAQTGATIPVGISVRVFLDVLAGLHAAHEGTDSKGEPLGIIHRDVSPDNILVGTDGLARLTDFGLARAQAGIGSTGAGRLKGKLAYMAPEQVLYGRVDRRCDIYAAGASLWEALTGRRMLQGETEGMLLAQVVAGGGLSPHEVNSEIPEPVSEICMRALHLQADQRYQTAADFAGELEQAAQWAFCLSNSREVSEFLKKLHKQSGELLGDIALFTPPGVHSSAKPPTGTNASQPGPLGSSEEFAFAEGGMSGRAINTDAAVTDPPVGAHGFFVRTRTAAVLALLVAMVAVGTFLAKVGRKPASSVASSSLPSAQVQVQDAAPTAVSSYPLPVVSAAPVVSVPASVAPVLSKGPAPINRPPSTGKPLRGKSSFDPDRL